MKLNRAGLGPKRGSASLDSCVNGIHSLLEAYESPQSIYLPRSPALCYPASKMLSRLAARRTGNREEARELVHDTWVRLAEDARAGAAPAEAADSDTSLRGPAG